MPIYGLSTEIARNIYTFDTLTAVGISESVEVRGTNLTFINIVTGGSVTWEIQCSLDGTNWASIDTAKTKSAGTHADFYTGRVTRYVRIEVTSINTGHTLSVTLGAS